MRLRRRAALLSLFLVLLGLTSGGTARMVYKDAVSRGASIHQDATAGQPTLDARTSWFDLLARPAEAGIPRVSKSWFFGPSVVWSSGSTTEPGLFHPLHDGMEARGLIDARTSLEMSEEFGDCELRSGVRFSNDGLTWNAAKLIYAQATNLTAPDSPQYQTAYVDLTQISGIAIGAYVQFGVFACNETSGNLSLCNATMRVEPKQLVK
jgi:hypothetical protein